MIPTIQHRVDFPCTRQEREVLFRVGYVEELEQGRHSDARNTAINACTYPWSVESEEVGLCGPASVRSIKRLVQCSRKPLSSAAPPWSHR
jgi:hypothetical protein